jgi:DNA adenine methylase
MIKSPLRYPGGKSKTAKLIVKLFPEFSEYREPFFGGGSLFFNIKQTLQNKKYWINDLYFELYKFWEMCQKDLQSVINKIEEWREKYKDGKELYEFLLSNREQFNDIEIAAFFFILNRITFSGTSESGGYSDQAFRLRFTRSSIERLKKIQGIFEDVKITNKDYKEVINIDGEDVFMFLDPPYFSAEKSGLYGKKGNMHKGFDHKEMSELLKENKHKWLITYDDSEHIRNLYSYANIIECDYYYSMKNWVKNKGESLKGKEIIITNFKIN